MFYARKKDIIGSLEPTGYYDRIGVGVAFAKRESWVEGYVLILVLSRVGNSELHFM